MQHSLTLRMGQRTAQAEVQSHFAVHRVQRRRHRVHVGQDEQVLHLHVSFERALRHEYTLGTDFLPTTA